MANGVCDSYCKGCVYCQLASGDATFICVYFLKTDTRRPCPAGTGCTVKATGKKVGAWAFQNNAEWVASKKARNEKRNEKRRIARTQEKRCIVCGKVFQTTDTRRRYCTDHAKRRHKPITKTCKICGKQFETTDGRRHLCSRQCVDVSRKNSYKTYDLKRKPKDDAQ